MSTPGDFKETIDNVFQSIPTASDLASVAHQLKEPARTSQAIARLTLGLMREIGPVNTNMTEFDPMDALNVGAPVVGASAAEQKQPPATNAVTAKKATSSKKGNEAPKLK